MRNPRRDPSSDSSEPVQLTDARASLAALLEQVTSHQRDITISHYRTPIAKLIPISHLASDLPVLRIMPVRRLRDAFKAAIWDVNTQRQAIKITQYSTPVAALIPLSLEPTSKEPPMLRIATWNESGGSGKTTIAVEAAFLLSQRMNPATGQPYRVLLVDTDPQASLSRRLGLSDDPSSPAHRLSSTVGSFLNDPAEDPPVPLTPAQFPGLHVIPANSKLSKVDATILMNDEDIGNLRLLLDHFEGRYDIVVIDTPPSRGGLARAALSAADHVLIPVNSSMKAIENFNQVLEVVQQCRRFSPNLKVSAFVVTSFSKNLNHDRDVLEILTTHYNAIAPSTTPITYRKSVFNDAMIGRTVVPLWKPKDPAVRELNLMVDEVLSFVGVRP
ncbi:ParA family protein [Deinococcus multiflagellatus]|uniref:AAA family ATPase n=1 Tax=Deinococcus multiflagellatus TaxID=1656887 RepID=A0ABW1ZP10_9DEIO|nr:ParA family protein [Deinococcus multiflagellatus]MBZ9715803.1 ParA family protein [Deinococcus multiflagellatus]